MIGILFIFKFSIVSNKTFIPAPGSIIDSSICKSISNLYLLARRSIFARNLLVFFLLKGGTITPPKIPPLEENIFAKSSPLVVSQNSNGARATNCKVNSDENFFCNLKSSIQISID